MKREEFLKRVSQMCGPAEVEAVLELAATPAARRRHAAVALGQASADQGLTDFLLSLIEDDLIDDLAAIRPGGSGRDEDEAEEMLKLLWTRLLLLITPEAKDVLYAHNQLRLALSQIQQRATGQRRQQPDLAYRSALENARAVLSATDDLVREKKPSEQPGANEARQ